MSLLSVIQDVISENGFGARPASIIGNSDALAVQCLALCNRAGRVIATAHDWQNMTQPWTITTVAGQETYDGPITTAGTQSPFRFIGDTFWDSTNYLPVTGSITAKEWQALKYGMGGTLTLGQRRFRVVYGSASAHGLTQYSKIHILPTPTASGDVLVCEYINPGWVITADFGGIAVGGFVSDNDTTAFPEHLLSLSLNWRIRKAKGFDYAEEFNEYERELSLAKAHDTPARTLDFGQRARFFLGLGNFPPTIETA